MKDVPLKTNTITQLEDSDWNDTFQDTKDWLVSSGQVLSAADLTQSAKAAAFYAGAGDMYEEIAPLGTSNFLIQPIGARQTVIAYVDGLRVRFISTFTPVAATVTTNIQISGLANKLCRIRRADAIPRRDVYKSGDLIEATYDLADDRFYITNVDRQYSYIQVGSSSVAGSGTQNVNFAASFADSSNGALAGVVVEQLSGAAQGDLLVTAISVTGFTVTNSNASSRDFGWMAFNNGSQVP